MNNQQQYEERLIEREYAEGFLSKSDRERELNKLNERKE